MIELHSFELHSSFDRLISCFSFFCESCLSNNSQWFIVFEWKKRTVRRAGPTPWPTVVLWSSKWLMHVRWIRTFLCSVHLCIMISDPIVDYFCSWFIRKYSSFFFASLFFVFFVVNIRKLFCRWASVDDLLFFSQTASISYLLIISLPLINKHESVKE